MMVRRIKVGEVRVTVVGGEKMRLHERFLRWTIGIVLNCPGYMSREKL